MKKIYEYVEKSAISLIKMRQFLAKGKIRQIIFSSIQSTLSTGGENIFLLFFLLLFLKKRY